MGRYWSPKRLYLPLLRPSKHSWDKHAPVVTSKFALQLCSWGWIRHLSPLQIWLILDCIYYPALSRSARCELLKFPPFTSCQYDKQPAGSLQGPALPFSLMGQARPNPRNSILTTVHCYCSIYCCSLTNKHEMVLSLSIYIPICVWAVGKAVLRLPYWRYEGNR